VFAQESEGSSCYIDQLDGGKNGALYNELVDYFYYSQVCTIYIFTAYTYTYMPCTMNLLTTSTTHRYILLHINDTLKHEYTYDSILRTFE
jgi:heme exporter protein D